MADRDRTLPGLNPPKGRGRFTHYVRANDRVSIPRYRCYVDTEAIRQPITETLERQTLSFGWACFERVIPTDRDGNHRNEWLRFTDAAEWWQYAGNFVKGNNTLYVYAHNLGYDAAMLSLATNAERFGWTVEEYVPGQHLLWVRVRKGQTRLCFVDTLNYFTTSLANLGQSIGFPKTTMPATDDSTEIWDAYCKNDVAVLRAAMHNYYALVKTEQLGAVRKTAAAQAYGAWRHRFMHHPVLIVADPELSAFERSAYHGGRSEVFYDNPILSPVFCHDINSMYPSVMRDCLYPSEKIASGSYQVGGLLDEMLADSCVIADVSLHTDEPVYPVNTGERVIYPVGRFRTVLSTAELRYALDAGHIELMHRWVRYTAVPLFKDYVDTLYRLRLEYRAAGNDAFAYLLKLLLNALYGKFGQRGYHWQRCEQDPIPGLTDWTGNCDDGGEIMRHRTRFGDLWHQTTDAEAFESFPAIAAHVTSYARMKLWHLINVAGRKHVYYVDTDSLYTSSQGHAQLAPYINPTELGALKLENTYKWAHFRAPKDYITGTYQKVKGVRKSARQLSYSEFQQEQFESYDSVLGRGADGEVFVNTITKRLERRNLQSRGHWSGWREPILLP